MDLKELIEMKKSGRKIPDEAWNALSDSEKKAILEKCKTKKGGSVKRNPWDAYAVSEQVAKDLGNIPYNVMAGVARAVAVELAASGSTTTSAGSTEVVFQSVFVIREDFVPGISTNRSSGINMASLQLYTTVRRSNSGAKNYEAPDLMMYVLAMQDIYALILKARKDIGLASLYDITNHNLPDALLQADGILPSDLRENIAQYRGRLNLIIEKANAFAVPKYFRAFEIVDHRMSNVFMDSSSSMGQYYLFRKIGRYLWSGTSSEEGTSLEYERMTSEDEDLEDQHLMKFSTLLDYIDEQLDAMFTDDDVNTMSGDILKHFGAGGLYQIAPVDESYVVRPIFDENVLAQIENLITRDHNGDTAPTLDLTLRQSNLGIVFNPTVSGASRGAVTILKAHVFNSHKDDPDYKDNLEWSRIHTIPKLNDNGTVTYTCGLEFIHDIFIYKRNLLSVGELTSFIKSMFYQVTVGVLSSALPITLVNPEIEQFDWHPFRYGIAVNSAYSAVNGVGVSGDIKKATWIDTATMENIDKAAVTALYWDRDTYKASNG